MNKSESVSINIDQINHRRWNVLGAAINILLKDAGCDINFEMKEEGDRLNIILNKCCEDEDEQV